MWSLLITVNGARKNNRSSNDGSQSTSGLWRYSVFVWLLVSIRHIFMLKVHHTLKCHNTHWHVSMVVNKWWHLADCKLLQFIKQQKIHLVNKQAHVTITLLFFWLSFFSHSPFFLTLLFFSLSFFSHSPFFLTLLFFFKRFGRMSNKRRFWEFFSFLNLEENLKINSGLNRIAT